MSQDIEVSTDETLANYAFSAPIGAVKQLEHRLEEGDGEDLARERAVKWAFQQIDASGANMNELMWRLDQVRVLSGLLMERVSKKYGVDLPDGYEEA